MSIVVAHTFIIHRDQGSCCFNALLFFLCLFLLLLAARKDPSAYIPSLIFICFTGPACALISSKNKRPKPKKNIRNWILGPDARHIFDGSLCTLTMGPSFYLYKPKTNKIENNNGLLIWKRFDSHVVAYWRVINIRSRIKCMTPDRHDYYDFSINRVCVSPNDANDSFRWFSVCWLFFCYWWPVSYCSNRVDMS